MHCKNQTDKFKFIIISLSFLDKEFIVHIWRLTRILERGPIPQNGNVIVFSVLRVRTLNNTMVIDTLECNGLFPHQPQTLISNLVNHFSRAFGENEIPVLT